MFASMSTISWSLRPGSTRVRVIKEMLFVRNKSSVLDVTPCLMFGLFLSTLTCVRVGSSTVCVRECVLIMSIKCSCKCFLSVCGSMQPSWVGLSSVACAVQLMSGRLKSPASHMFLEGSILDKDSSRVCRYSRFELGGR